MSNQLRKCVSYALTVCSVSAVTAPSIFAQNVPANTDQAAANTTQLGKIQVTGTRILQSTIQTAQPITIVTKAQIQQSGLVTVGSVLASLPQLSSNFNLDIDNTSLGTQIGQNQISLRYFGSNRVLVLVDGQRWSENIDGSVDLNTIPASMIDHIEILQDGASAIYGSDAITGVVNIITVKNFNGAEANAYLGMYDAKGIGGGWDGRKQSYNFTIGSNSQRYGITFNAAYSNEDPVWSSNRTYSNTFAQLPFRIQRLGPYPSNGRFQIVDPNVTTIGQATASSGGLFDMTLINAPTNNPTLSNFQNVPPGQIPSSMIGAYESELLSPLTSKSIFVTGHYDIADNLTFTSMADTVINTGNSEYLGPTMVDMGAGGFILRNDASFGVGANNPYNPFHEDLVANGSEYCPSGTLVSGPNAGQACQQNLELALLGRTIDALGPRVSTAVNTNYTFRMGLNGFFDAIGHEWDWNLGATTGSNTQDIDNLNEINTVNLAQAVDAPGYAQCNGPGQTTKPAGNSTLINGLYYPILLPGCVPLNLFGGSGTQGSGAYYTSAANANDSITPAQVRYFETDDPFNSGNSLTDYNANITGTLMDIPSGPVKLAVGAEHYDQGGFFHPSSLQESGNAYFGGFQPTDGKEWVSAEYFEINIPLLSDVPLFKSLSLDLANRWSQFSWAGGNPGTPGYGEVNGAHASTGQAKLRWQATTDLLLRGSWSQGFRVPSISELFAGEVQGSGNGVEDPCAPFTQDGSWNPTTPLPAGCHGLVHSQLSSQIETIQGSNPHMTPETSISRSAGFVYNPEWIPGFDISADYYKIDLNNVIGSNAEQFVLDQCFIEQSPQYCSKITLIGNRITLISNLNTNTGEVYSRGTDVSVGYHFPATNAGVFGLSTSWTFVQSYVAVTSSAASPTGWQSAEERGLSSVPLAIGVGMGIPQRKGQLGVNWSLNNWSALWTVQYIGPQWGACSGTSLQLNQCSNPKAIYSVGGIQSQGMNHVGTTLYHNVQITYHSDAINTDFTFGVRNIFDKLTPAGGSAELYPFGGRFLYLSIGAKF